MDEHTTIRDKKPPVRKEVLIACSVLAICGVCAFCLTGATFWGLNQRNARISAESTSTASRMGTVEAYATSTVVAQITEQADLTATAVARPTEQAEYAIVDHFDDNGESWLTESSNDEFMVGGISINGGIYAWNIREVKQEFIYWAQFRYGRPFEDFDMYVDAIIKTSDAQPGDYCSGFVFRTASYDLEKGAYTFSVCNNSYFDVDYYADGDWDVISDWTYSESIRSDDWNRIEVSARGDHFTFIINNEVVFEMTDDRLPKGGVGVLIEVNEKDPVKIWFDNFGIQSR